ncbi:MAG: 7-carboxy-7-deazaguanine synthase QueE, partial [Planctomycetota bacterium]
METFTSQPDGLTVNGTMTHLETIFTSIQGEGIYVGVPQLFIRFSGCNLKCLYCDTPEARVPHPMARIENKPFQRNFKLVSNPIKIENLSREVFNLADNFPEIHSVVLTGGEPLVATGFLRNFLPELKKKNLRIFLETNGTLPDQLKSILEFIDIISMDIKIPSAVGREVDWDKTVEFLKISAQRVVYTKILVTGLEKPEELTRARALIAGVNKKIPLVLQPFSPILSGGAPTGNHTNNHRS